MRGVEVTGLAFDIRGLDGAALLDSPYGISTGFG